MGIIGGRGDHMTGWLSTNESVGEILAHLTAIIYYIKLQCPFVCLSVPPPFWHDRQTVTKFDTHSNRYETGSHLKNLTHLRGIPETKTAATTRRQAGRQHDVILRNVGGSF